MKVKQLILIIYLFSGIHLFAQTETVNRFFSNSGYGYGKEGVYYKDLDGYFNQYIGTWLYTNGTTSLKIKFEKKYFTINRGEAGIYYTDALIGEYQYIKNGVEVFNTLSNLSNHHSTPYNYHIFDVTRLENDPSCTHCVVPFQRLLLDYDEPTNDNMTLKGNMGILTFTENGQTKMWLGYATDYGMGMRIKKGDPDTNASTTELTLPNGIYIFTKIE